MTSTNTLTSKEQGNYKNFTIQETKEDKEQNITTTKQIEFRNGLMFMRLKKRKNNAQKCCGF